MAAYQPPPPEGAGSPFAWGDREHLEELLGGAFDLRYEEGDAPQPGRLGRGRLGAVLDLLRADQGAGRARWTTSAGRRCGRTGSPTSSSSRWRAAASASRGPTCWSWAKGARRRRRSAPPAHPGGRERTGRRPAAGRRDRCSAEARTRARRGGGERRRPGPTARRRRRRARRRRRRRGPATGSRRAASHSLQPPSPHPYEVPSQWATKPAPASSRGPRHLRRPRLRRGPERRQVLVEVGAQAQREPLDEPDER